MRERPPAHTSPPLALRITPARAGKTIRFSRPYKRLGDHPRSCGKDRPSRAASDSPSGSPPLVRERLCRAFLLSRDAGITPARAGKTGCHPPKSRPGQDHPRSCGKDRWKYGILGFDLGSPPLVRERHTEQLLRIIQSGITPARAGKTILCFCKELQCRDHPRSCGKDSNGSLYLRHFALAGIQNLFNFFAGYLSTKKHKARFVKI